MSLQAYLPEIPGKFDRDPNVDGAQLPEAHSLPVVPAKLKITLKYLQRVEAGRHNLSVDSLVRFSRVLKAEPKALFEEPRTLMVNVGRPRKRAL